MFRYIALAWDDASPTSSAAARQLGLRLQADPEWRSALHRPGLHVFVAGARDGANGVYPLLGDQGIVLGKLFRRRDLGRPSVNDLSLTNDEASRILQDCGHTLVRDFWGRYVAFMATAPGATGILRDPSGTLPCFVMRHRGVRIVFSWLEDVLATLRPERNPEVNWDGVAAQLVFGELGGRETALEGVTRILPGEILQVGGGTEQSDVLWNAVDFARTPSHDSFEEASERLRDTVRACARSWADCYDGILFRLSGGVDSSILLSCLASGSTPADVVCVNYHSPGSDSDERSYARAAAARARRELVERERDPRYRLERTLAIARTPTPGNYVGWMNSRADTNLAAWHGAEALFTGAGGDQLFFEFGRWWPAADYLRWRGFDTGFTAAAMDAARLGGVSVWKAVALALADRVHPGLLPEETGKHLTLIGPAAWSGAKQRERFVHPALLRATDLPVGKLNQTRALMHPIGYYDPFEQAAAPELVNPLLSQPLVELCLRLPTYLLTRGGRGRALARRAFADDLPPEIAGRRSKGGMEEHTKTVLLRNMDFARGMLIDGELVRRGLLDRTEVEEALSGRPTPQATPIGRIHACIGIEAWLSRWSAQPHQSAA